MSSGESGIMSSQTDKKKVKFNVSGSKRVHMKTSNSMLVFTTKINDDDMQNVPLPYVTALKADNFVVKDNES